MSAGPVQTQIILVPYRRRLEKHEHPRSCHHKARRELWKPQCDIPHPVVDHDLVERLRRVGQDALKHAKPQLEAMLAQART
jgi:hypothetical protein